ncbi:methylase involved in ubiquinone/menaquinone biosynthesis [Candidatus Methanoperedens nitroreducens]|uniref:Methylase involved in ubiquinone/menaquinone biosynthesis n=1 Tax=Candidatus Methanoperedens nitratireducens TaxID=1392998 RepID=A0A062V057_9EURY|nr:methyltransferase domain-containing protein [Candidatus Methanoperedens nitroreducens]KCZ70787.1 methylase involved in ubiquinone/menaquinone biosynthesis [Candidatus Methanoperedens nitroreducens]MDJ1420642.1 methyltransferase domain-containing protein [Candidatus Methanoperedens sp.]
MKKTDSIKDLQQYYPLFNEGYGTEYERFALNKFIPRMVNKYSISTVLEMPANGVMGIPGIKSLGFAKIGCDVTVSHPSQTFLDTARKVWDAFGLEAKFIKSCWIGSKFKDDSFDLVWNFCVYEHFDNPGEVIQEMLRVTHRYIFLEIQNALNIGFPVHRLYHFLKRDAWDHGNLDQMKLSSIREIVNKNNALIVETGATDMPPWPDINIRLKEMASKKNNDQRIDKNPADKLRPAAGLKDVSEVINEIRLFQKSSTKNEIVFHLFNLWHLLIESSTPAPLKKFYAHHPYVIAEKI